MERNSNESFNLLSNVKPIIWQILMAQDITQQAKEVKELIFIATTNKLTQKCLRISNSFMMIFV